MSSNQGAVSTAQVERWVHALGVHKHVPTRVTGVSGHGAPLRVDVTLSYRRAHPICCSEPSCYCRFLRSDRLGRLSEDLRRAHGWLVLPLLEVHVSADFEAGFRFREPWAEPWHAPRVYRHAPGDPV